jgi:hypothetical protein
MAPVTRGHGLEVEVDHGVGVHFAEMPSLCAEVLVSVHDPVGSNGIGDALDLDFAMLLAENPVSDMGEGFVGGEDLARRG